MTRMNDLKSQATLKAAVLLSVVLLFAVAAFGQQQINLAATPTTTTLPDGSTLPMWGYFCGTAAAGSTATCAALNAASAGTNTTAATWSPVLITVPAGQGLTINLTNNLSFTPSVGATANTIPTSIVIVGQVGGGLGDPTQRTTTPSPDHSNAQGCITWFIANTSPGQPCNSTTAPPSGALPPLQGSRVQSMATEVVAGATTALTWNGLKPGTYLLESGTHPSIQVPMGLIGVLVVTTAPANGAAGIAYPAVGSSPQVQYSAELPLEFSEVDPVQNREVDTAVRTAGFSETAVWSGMNAGGVVGCGVTHTCYPPAVNYTPFYFLINGVAFNKTAPAVSAFQATAGVTANPAGGSPIAVTTGITGNVLVRLVNAGLRMHVPSIVGSQTQGFTGAGALTTPANPVSGFTLIAEDGNPVPNLAAPRVQTDVFMAAGKTFDVMIAAPVCTPAVGATSCANPDLPIYDRELSLSGNSSVRDAGMLAYISVNNANAAAGLPVTVGSGVFAAAKANNDTYNSLVAGQALTVSDPSKGVIANDVNVYGVQLLSGPTNGTLTCPAAVQGTSNAGICANGTFTYTPNASSLATSDNFTYCANNGFTPATGTTAASCSSAALTATVTLGASNLTGALTAVPQTYMAKSSTYLKIASPGLLIGNTDPNSLPLSVVPAQSNPNGGVLVVDAGGGFTLSQPSNSAASQFTFQYTLQNSHGVQSAPATVTVNFPAPSNLQVTVVDAAAFANCNGSSACISGLTAITDYRWIIEEDRTFYVDPNCTTNSSATTAGCPGIVATGGTVPTFGVQFHTSSMPYIAQGCTGPLSCESGQTMLDSRPACTAPNVPAGCSATAGQHIAAICDVGNGACRPDPSAASPTGTTPVLPSSVALDPSKRYYISVLPGDAANPFAAAYAGQPGCDPKTGAQPGANGNPCGHGMSGAPIPAACNVLGGPNACTAGSTFAAVLVKALPTPFPTGSLSVFVFEDDFPLNGEQDGGGGVDVLSPNEPGLGSFNLVLWDTYGTLGDATGQDSYDAFNQPLSNSLAGTIDPATGLDACPISPVTTSQPGQQGIIGMITTCPKYESDNATLSPLAGQAVIANLMADKFSVQAYPGADRIARGEEWIQTNTLDGQHPHDSFIRVGEPGYFQEFGPAGYHVSIGFANPAIINARHDAVCAGAFGPVGACSGTLKGQVDVQRLSRTPDQRLYPSGSRDALAWTQCWVSLGDPDAEDFMFTKCDANGNFKFSNVPAGNWRVTIGDQWNDQIIDGLSTPANVTAGQTLDMGNIGVQQWQSNLYTKTYIDDNKNGLPESNEIGIPFIITTVRYRDGSRANMLGTDFNGVANFNETFPLFNWYTVEADTTRYKRTGTHTVYDAGGPSDGSSLCGPGNGARPCGSSTAYNFLANTYEALPLPADLSVPGAVYCATADCTAEANTFFLKGLANLSSSTVSTGRIDPPWVATEGWSGETSQGNWIEFGMAPYAECPPACTTVTTTLPGSTTPTSTQVGENGGIHGHVVYASTRPFDDASLLVQQPWEPLVPHVTINLYQEGFAADGVTRTLTLVDTTQTSSWDDWAQGFWPNYTDPVTGTPKPYMNCPGQGTATSANNADLFFFTLFDQPNYLDWYNGVHSNPQTPPNTLPYNSQYKCYDAMHIWNQIQPAPYDGMYSFPSSLGVDPTSGKLLAVKGSTNGVASSMNGTNCTICVANPDTTDLFRSGTPMLPPGKYVVEVVMPPGFEVEKEEDKNLLIGDNYIAPVTQQFPGFGGSIFIMPDQASVSSLYDPSGAGYNPNNFQNETTAVGASQQSQIVPGFVEPVWPCAGELRVVPDYLSLFPQALESAPFAGATRPLCDRKEVTLANQMGATAKFSIFTSAHIASKFTGVITDDFTSEFDPFAPQFGEKFAPPNMPISTKDYLGNEISRVYSDHFGIYDGLTYSTWEVNPPNITGYGPQMFVQCMNDPGPIPDGKGGLMNDPLYNPAYSDFCYEEPYMPGLTTYLDTPVVPTQAFVGAGYNNADCAYPDATPAVAEVDGDGIGPWVSAAGKTLTITALGNQTVTNYGYAGPSANVAPFDAKTISRHYGFGPQCTALGGSCTAVSSVTIGGVAATIGTWTDTSISVTVPKGVPNCTIEQQTQYGGSTAQCGELVIMAGNGKQSIDAVTVTIGGKTPTHVAASQTIQSVIDAAAPGDLIIVDPTCSTAGGPVACTTAGVTKAPAAHTEMLIMWKPVRLQGVGAATTIVNANTHPAGKMLDPWRRHINCLFGLTLQGVPYSSGTNSTTSPANPSPYDGSGSYSCPDAGWNYFTAQPNAPQIDRLPLEAVVGWDATQNGNLAELLQEPTLMGAYEGAGITVLGKGLEFHGQLPWSDGTETGAFPPQTTLLSGVVSDPADLTGPGTMQLGDANTFCHTVTYNPRNGRPTITNQTNPYPSNFICNPSSIDGLTVTNSSQGGGGIFVHGWAHNLEIANDRVYNNVGTLSGGISVGQGEFALPYIQGSATNAAPGSCSNGRGFVDNQHLPMCLQLHVNVHNNMITDNSAIGDELFSATLSGGGGATVCTGNDYYKFGFNWFCGNMSSGEGGGMVHLGEIQNGLIAHNTFAFNQSTNPTIPTNGGGIMVQGTPDTDPVCPGVPDTDCPPGLSDGSGHGLVIDANLIQGNSADSGAGGGIRLNQVNGTEVGTFAAHPERWNDVSITNNVIVNNVAGWDGGGISLQDALKVQIVNNTIMHNDSLATSGVLINSLGAPMASAPVGSCTMPGPSGADSASCPQPAGVSSTPNSSLLLAAMSGLSITCPQGHAGCQTFSNPILFGDVISQNRSFYVGITGKDTTGNLNQQNRVSLFAAFTASLAPNQASTGSCGGTPAFPATSYWDLGVRGDKTTAPGSSTIGNTGPKLNPLSSFLSSTTGYAASNSAMDPTVTQTYCNGSRVPPECTVANGCGGPNGFGVPPGINDAVTPNPLFSLVPSATVDEGNNWINVSWGPLSMLNPVSGATLGNYTPQANAPTIDYIALNSVPGYVSIPPADFFGNPRPDPANRTRIDSGAVEIQGSVAPPTLTSIVPNQGTRGTAVFVTLTGTNFTPGSTIGVTGNGITVSGTSVVSTTKITATFTMTRGAALGARNVTVTAGGGTTLPVTFTVQGATLAISAPVPPLCSNLPGSGGCSAGVAPNTSTKNGTITVSNTAAGANASPFTFTLAPTIAKAGGAGNGTFSIVAGGTCVNGFVINPGSNCSINVRYSGETNTSTANGQVTVTGIGLATSTASSSPFPAN